MKELARFIKTSGIYLVGNVLTKAIAFIMLPVYTKYLSPTDYGTYDVNIAYITFLCSVLFFDIWSGTMRFMFDYQGKEDKNSPIVSGTLIFIFSTILYTIVTFSLGKIMGVTYVFLLFLYGLTTNLQQFFAYVIRGFGKNTLFAAAGLIGSVVTIVLNIIFIAVFHKGYQYLYVSSIGGALINSLLLLSGINLNSILKKKYFNKKLTIEMFIFSLPLTINSVSWWFLTAFNRVALTNHFSAYANGLYAVANKFSATIQLVDQAFQMAWQEISFSKEGASSNNSVFFSKAINEYIKFMTLGICVILPLVRIIFPYFVNPSYNAALQVVPLALIAMLLSSISTFLGGTLTAIKQNRYLFTTTIFGTIVNVIVLEATIGSIKIQAASLALGLGYLVVDVRRYQLLKRHIQVRLQCSMIVMLGVGLTFSSAIFLFLSPLLNIIWFAIAFSIMILFYLKIIRLLIYKFQSKG